MTTGKLTIEIDGDEAKAHAAYISLSADQKALVAELGKVGSAAEAAANKSIQAAKKEAAERATQINLASNLVKANENVTQAYARQKAALDTALAAGNITAEQYKQTLATIETKINQSSAASIEAAKKESTARATQITAAASLVKANEDVTQAYQRQKKSLDAALAAGSITATQYHTTLDKIKEKADKASRSVELVENATDKGVGAGSVAKIVDFAAKFGTIAVAVGVVKKALEFYNAEKEKAIGSTDAMVDVRRSLLQVSHGDYEELQNQADSLTRFGLTNVEGGQLRFDARSQGFEKKEDMETVARSNPVINVTDGAAFAGEFRKYFKNENLTVEQAYNTALAGADQSKFNITRLLPQVRTAAQGNLRGGESSDVVAATSVLADKFGESTGTGLRQLGIKLATNDETAGLNLIDAMAKLEQDPALRKKVEGGSSEIIATTTAFIEMRDRIVEIDKKIEAEQQKTGDAGLLEMKMKEYYNPDTNKGQINIARRDAINAQAILERETESNFSEEAFKVRGARDAAIADSKDLSFSSRVGASLGANAAASVSDDAETVSATSRFFQKLFYSIMSPGAAANFGRDDSAAKQEAIQQEQLNESKKQTNALNKLNAVTGI